MKLSIFASIAAILCAIVSAQTTCGTITCTSFLPYCCTTTSSGFTYKTCTTSSATCSGSTGGTCSSDSDCSNSSLPECCLGVCTVNGACKAASLGITIIILIIVGSILCCVGVIVGIVCCVKSCNRQRENAEISQI